MKFAEKLGALTLISLLVSLPLVYWIKPNTGAGATLLIVILLLATNVVGGFLWNIKQTTRSNTDSKRESTPDR